MADYTLSAKGTYDGRNFDSGIDSSSRKLDDFKNRCTATQVAVGNLMSGAIARIGSAISSSLDAAIGRVDTMNNFTKVMTNLGVSAEAAQKSIDTLSGDALKGLPTTLDAAVAGVQRLTSKNEDVQKSTEYFLALNNAVIAGDAGMELQAGAIEQLSQAYAKGKMDMQEWRMLQQAMPAQLNQIAKAMGITADELGDGLRSGSVSMEKFMKTMVQLNKQGIEGFASLEQQARSATGGIATQLTNLRTAVTRAVANVIDKFNESGAVTKTVKMVTDAVNVLGKTVAPVASEAGARVAELADVLGEAFEPLAKELPEDGAAFAQTLGALVGGVTELVKALSPVLPTLAKIAPAMLLAHSASSQLATKITTLADGVLPLFKVAAMEGSAAAGALGGKLSSLAAFAGGPMVAGITAAVAVIGILVATYAEAKRKQEEYEQATTGLVEASESLGKASSSAAEGVKSVGDAAAASTASIQGCSKSVDELVQKQAELTKAMGEQFEKVNTDNTVLQTYSDTIERLAGRCEGSAEDLAELKSAVKSYNDIAGTSYKVTDDLTGALNVSTDAVAENTEAFKRRSDAVAAQENLAKVQERLAENEAKLAEAEKSLKGAEEAERQSAQDTAEMKEYLADQTWNASQEVARLKGLIDSDKQSIESLTATIRAGGPDAFKDMADSARDMGDAMEESAEVSEEAVKAFQKQLDAAYKAQQRAFNAEYKSAQRAMNAQYKAAQKAYDAQYKALQKELSAEESALAKSHDEQYEQARKAYDAQYEARKKSLDSKYEALKDSLDGELEALRKANDKALGELKRSQDAQVDAFQKATKKRIAAIDEEYAAKLKLLDAEQDRRTKSIDDQISELQGRTKAEQEQSKRAEQEQRKAELQKAVNTARYASERKAREQELSEYLAEIERERAEEQRAELVEQLNERKDAIKEEVSAKKDALVQERDARKEAVTESRAAELEAIKEANEAEAEVMREAQEAKETAMAESHERRLESLRESQDAQLETLKEAQSDQLEALKESQQAEQDAMREAHSEQLDAMRDSQSEQLDALKESQSDQLDAMKEAQSDALEALKESQANQLEAFKSGNKQAEDEAEASAERSAQKTKAALDRNSPEVQKKVADMKEAILGIIHGGEDEAGESGEALGQKWGDGIGTKEGFSSYAGGKLKDAALEGMSSDGTEASEAGGNFIQGFIDGLSDYWGTQNVWTAAWNVGQTALSSLMQSLGIASPSKEAARMGRFFSLGMAEGIDEESGAVVAQAASMARGALDAVGRMPSPSLGTIGYAGSVSAVPRSSSRAERRSAEPEGGGRGGLSIYIGEMTVRNRSDADYFSEILCDKWNREGAGAL